MLEYFNDCRNGIIKKIDNALATLEAVSDPLLSAGDFSGRLRSYMLGGKMIRGALVRLGAELFQTGDQELSSDALDWVGAAMEFFQAGLLVHDDIMDRDTVRRGLTTVHWQYVEEAARTCGCAVASREAEADPEALHYGESQGICAGDLAFFLGNYCLAEAGAFLPLNGIGSAAMREGAQGKDIPRGVNLLLFSNIELCKVGLAQMLDVRFGTSLFGAEPSRDEIITIYRYKTGRYTFSLPLGLGARVAGAENSVISDLERYGECLGIVFQLKDDELGIWASEAVLGKSPGIDVREDKKTLHRKLFINLMEQERRPESERMLANFGNRNLSEASLAELRMAMESNGIRDSVRLVMRDYINDARTIRERLPFTNPKAIQALLELEQYSLERGF